MIIEFALFCVGGKSPILYRNGWNSILVYKTDTGYTYIIFNQIVSYRIIYVRSETVNSKRWKRKECKTFRSDSELLGDAMRMGMKLHFDEFKLNVI